MNMKPQLKLLAEGVRDKPYLCLHIYGCPLVGRYVHTLCILYTASSFSVSLLCISFRSTSKWEGHRTSFSFSRTSYLLSTYLTVMVLHLSLYL